MKKAKWGLRAAASITLAGSGLVGLSTVAVAAKEGAASSKITLTMLMDNDFETSLPPVIKAFEKANPSVSISVKYITSTVADQIVEPELQNGTAPDIVTAGPGDTGGGAVYQEYTHFVNLSNQPWAKETPAGYKSALGPNGQVYMLPLSLLSVNAIYNQTALNSLHMSVPTTWNQVLSLCKAATTAGIGAYALGAATDYENQMIIYPMESDLVERSTPDFTQLRAKNKVSFTHSGWLTAFKDEQTMSKDGCLTKDPLGTSITAAQSELASGKALGYFGLSFQITAIEALNPKDKFVEATFPATNNPKQTGLDIALDTSYGINRDVSPSVLAVAEKFSDFLMSPAQLAAWSDATAGAPGIKDPLFKPNAITKLIVSAQADGTGTSVEDQFWPNPNIRSVWIVDNEKMLAGELTPLQIVQAMDKAY
jgi:raffinose/stachyose/melibiose transport system substrate-binding protein